VVIEAAEIPPLDVDDGTVTAGFLSSWLLVGVPGSVCSFFTGGNLVALAETTAGWPGGTAGGAWGTPPGGEPASSLMVATSCC
jgi:hypothetical protein